MTQDDQDSDHHRLTDHSFTNTLLQSISRTSSDIIHIKASIQSDHQNQHRTLVSTDQLQEGTPIISIPDSALLNSTTLPDDFKTRYQAFSLSSVQALSIFLAESRRNRLIAQDHFRAYVDSLPRSFGSVPLVSILNTHLGDLQQILVSDTDALDRLERSYRIKDLRDGLLKACTTASLAHRCDEVTLRFVGDWKALARLPACLTRAITLLDFLWGWLNVNTRSLWFDLGCKIHTDNITLAPIIDMANHATESSVVLVATPHTLSMYSSYPSNTFASPRSKTLLRSSKSTVPPSGSSPSFTHRRGDEIVFCYGPHGNATLWVEYGFVMDKSNVWDSIDITCAIEKLFESVPNKLDTLRSTAYAGDYTIQFQPPGPSHRTMVALRWLHYPEAQVEDWYAHLRGERDDLGGANEGRVNKTLQSLYHALALEAQTKLDDLVKRKKVDGCELRDGLRKLLQDELKILLMLIGSES